MKTIICDRVLHNGENRVTLRFPYDTRLISITRRIEDAKWSKTMYCWHIPDNEKVIDSLTGLFNGQAILGFSAIKAAFTDDNTKSEPVEVKIDNLGKEVQADNQNYVLSEKGKADIARFKKWLEVNRYPESTIRTYTGMIVTFLKFVSPKEAEECDSEDLVRIVDEYILPKGLSHSFQNQMVSAVKKFYGKIYKSVIDPGDISRPRPQQRLPKCIE